MGSGPDDSEDDEVERDSRGVCENDVEAACRADGVSKPGQHDCDEDRRGRSDEPAQPLLDADLVDDRFKQRENQRGDNQTGDLRGPVG